MDRGRQSDVDVDTNVWNDAKREGKECTANVEAAAITSEHPETRKGMIRPGMTNLNVKIVAESHVVRDAVEACTTTQPNPW